MSETVSPGYEALHTTMTFPPLARYNHLLRMRNVVAVMKQHDTKGMLDVGCGDGRFIRRCLKSGIPGMLIGMDIWDERLARARRDSLAYNSESSAAFIEGSMTAIAEALPDPSAIRGTGAVVLLETIEHVPLEATPLVMDGVLGHVEPKIAIVTTPDATVALTPEKMTARGHHFEWTIPEFKDWASHIAVRHGSYDVELQQITGSTFMRNTQMAIFTRT